jgi:hypothetical protein
MKMIKSDEMVDEINSKASHPQIEIIVIRAIDM